MQVCFTNFHTLQNNVNFLITAQGGYSPLYVASQNGHTEVVDILLNSGADVHQANTTVSHFLCEVVLHKVSKSLFSDKCQVILVLCEGEVVEKGRVNN